MYHFIETLQTPLSTDTIYLSDSDDLPESVVSPTFQKRHSQTGPSASASVHVRQVGAM